MKGNYTGQKTVVFTQNKDVAQRAEVRVINEKLAQVCPTDGEAFANDGSATMYFFQQ